MAENHNRRSLGIRPDWQIYGERSRVGHSRRVPREEELGRYQHQPSQVTSAADAELVKEMRSAGLDPVGIAELVHFSDNTHGPTVEEAITARKVADSRLSGDVERVQAHNEPLEASLENHVTLRDELILDHLKERKSLEGQRRTLWFQLATACGSAGLTLDPNRPVPVVPEQSTRSSLAAHAADLKLPHDPHETKHFFPPLVEWLVSIIVGIVVGLSAFSAAHLIRLRALGTDPPLEFIGTILGIVATIAAGFGVKLLWKYSSELYYLGRRWQPVTALAVLVTTFIVTVDVVVERQGIMAAVGLQLQVLKLSNAPVSTQSSELIALFVAAVVTLGYFVYAAIRGWTKDRTAAANRVELSAEHERLRRLSDVQKNEHWTSVLHAGNAILAIDAHITASDRAYRSSLGLIKEHEAYLKSELRCEPTGWTDSEILIHEKQVREAQGTQIEMDRRILALREGRIYVPANVGQGSRRRVHGARWFRSLIQSWSRRGAN